MKFNHKCPKCGRKATKRIGKIKVCDDCHKNIRKNKLTIVWEEFYAGSYKGLKFYGDRIVKIY